MRGKEKDKERKRQRETCKNKVRTKSMRTRDADGKRLYKTFECEMNFNLCFILQEKKNRKPQGNCRVSIARNGYHSSVY